MIPQATVDQILDAARIEEVVSDFVTLRRRGASLVACCPFHNEKTPSFYVTPSKGIFKCFGCGKAGSAVGFIMEHEHCSYVEALKYLAKKYHIEVQEREDSPEELAQKQKSESLMLVSDFAQKFFSDNLKTAEGRALGLQYLHSRGLDDNTIARFGLGWAPSAKSALADAAIAAGFKAEYLIETGLCIRYDDGRLVDRFHERVMFPIHSVSGRVIAFSGRTLKSDTNIAKYVNSPETPIYVKSRALYGLYLAKASIARYDRCYLAEGNVDVVSMHQLGIDNVLASCGTSLTEEQIRIIKKFTENVTVMYDGDKAGIHAALRAIGMILKEGMNVRLLLFPDGDDPDSYCRKHTLEEVRSFIASNEEDFLSYMIRVNPLGDGDPLKRAKLINDIADTIALIPDAVKRSVYLSSAAQQLGIEANVILDRISSTKNRLMEEEAKLEERRRRRTEAGLDPDFDAQSPGADQQLPQKAEQLSMDALLVNKAVAPAEKDLLFFMLTHGTEVLDFETDSDYYSGSENDKPLVAEFIRMALEEGNEFLNPALESTYLAYMEAYDEGYSQEEILHRLINSPDRKVAFVAAELSIERYQLTVKAFEDALTTTSTWLVMYVPRAILCYHESRLNYRISELRGQLAQSSDIDRQERILQEMMSLQAALAKVKAKLGR